VLSKYLPKANKMHECLRVIEIASFRPDHHMEIVMDNDKGIAVAFLAPG
jgi:hypothetical protein